MTSSITQPIPWLDGPLWPYLALLLFAVLPTEVWRWLAVAFSRRIDANSPALEWVRAVATALLAGIVAKLIVAPPGALAALSVTLGIMLFDRRRVLLAVLAGEATLVAGAWWLLRG